LASVLAGFGDGADAGNTTGLGLTHCRDAHVECDSLPGQPVFTTMHTSPEAQSLDVLQNCCTAAASPALEIATAMKAIFLTMQILQ